MVTPVTSSNPADSQLKALITGGGVGVGASIAHDFHQDGHTVAVTYLTHDPEQPDNSGEGRAPEFLARRVDFRNEAEAMGAITDLAGAMDGIDVLVNNVGGLLGRVPFETMTPQYWRDVIDLNVHSMFYATSAALPHLADGRGRVINMSSLAAQTGGGAGSTAYAAAKAAMLGFTRGLAKELAPRGITVNAVAPGFIQGTPFHDQFTPVEAQQASIQQIPLKRAGQPRDVAEVVRWLASEGSAFVTGACIDVNGGQWFT